MSGSLPIYNVASTGQRLIRQVCYSVTCYQVSDGTEGKNKNKQNCIPGSCGFSTEPEMREMGKIRTCLPTRIVYSF